MTFDGGAYPVLYTFGEQGACVVEVLLFVQDFPVIMRAFSFLVTGPFPVVEPDAMLELDNFSGYGNQLYTTTQADPIGYASASYGVTITDGVDISGYNVLIVPLLTGIGESSTATMQLDAVTNASVMAGRARAQGDHGDTLIQPIILLESDFTQDMADAGNVFVSTNGPITITSVVVGIFSEVATGV
jgi:hypothetical protein